MRSRKNKVEDREFYHRETSGSSEGRGYGGGKEGIGRGGGYLVEPKASKAQPLGKEGTRRLVMEARGFKDEQSYGKSNARGTRTGPKAKSQRRGQRKHAGA